MSNHSPSARKLLAQVEIFFYFVLFSIGFKKNKNTEEQNKCICSFDFADDRVHQNAVLNILRGKFFYDRVSTKVVVLGRKAKLLLSGSPDMVCNSDV